MTTIIIPTPKSALRQHEGRPVPWVARWSEEVVNDPVGISWHGETLVAAYHNGRENREASGILWKREGVSHKGEPQYAQVNTYRQRACMTKRLCQMCGRKITDRVITWLMPKANLDIIEDGALSMSAPTCEACIPLALDVCPHLKVAGNSTILRVLDYEVWGIYGDAVIMDPETDKLREHKGLMIEYGGTYPGLSLPAVIAKQQVVKLTKYVVQEEV